MKLFELDKRKRRPKDPDITGYEEVPKKKKEPDIIDKVVVHLKGKRSAYFTKLARRFNDAKVIKEELAIEEKALKAETREAVDAIFDVGDEVYTRVVETASLVFKVSKAEERTSETLDVKGYLEELEKLTGIAVDQLEKIKEKHIKKSVGKVLPKVSAPKEKKTKESVNEGILDQAKDYASRVYQHVMSFLSKWDQRFARVKAQIESELI